MSKYKGGARDEGRDHISSRQKTSYEPVLGSSVNPGPSEDCHNSHEAHTEEKDPIRSQDFRGGAGHRHTTNDSDNHSGRLHHKEDEPRPHVEGQSRGGAETKSAEKRRSHSPESRSRISAGHNGGGRGGAGRIHETNNRDRRSPDKRRERRSSRSRSRDRRRSRSRSQDRHRSRSRDRERRRPRSRSQDRRKSRSRERKYRRSRSRDRARHRSHSRSRSRTPSRPRHVGPTTSKPAAKTDDGKVDAQKKLIELSNEKPSNLPLNDLSQPARVGLMTPQMAVQQAMAAMNARAQQLTGVTLPKYYNPAAVNPLKYAEQMQKRKLLWQSAPKKEVPAPSTNNWECTTFAQDQDGKVAAKFKKLMGIKGASEEGVPPPTSEEQLRKQEELFRTLDQQYETARMSTHSYRGVGLGFSSAAVAAANAVPTTILFPK